MDFNYSPLQKNFSEEIIRFSQKKLSPGAINRDREQSFDRELWMSCGKMGLHGLAIPEEYDGLELDPLSVAIALEAFGYGCEDGGLVFAVCAQLLSCTVPIVRFGTEKQKEKYLPPLAKGQAIAVNCMTESESGSDAFRMETRATRVHGGYRISGTKTFSSNGPVADVALLYATTDVEKGYYGGITAFLVDKGVEGFSVGQKYEKMGLRTCLISEMVFDDVFVDEDAVLGGVGGGATVFSDSMSWERTCIASSHVGTIRRLLEKAISYARTRKSAGRKIGDYQAVAHKLADVKIALETGRLLTYRTASKLDTARDVALDASMVKVFVSESLLAAAMETLQVFGGYGFMSEYEIERAFRDAVASRIYSGTNEVQRNIIAKWLLSS